jgi:hypothetical protein
MVWYDIFKCNWVDTRWQQYSTHLHTNRTQNNTFDTNNTQNTHKYVHMHDNFLQLRCLGWIAQMNFFISSWTITVCAHYGLSLFTLNLFLVSPSLFRSPHGTGVRDYLPPYCPHVSTISIAIGSRFQVRRLRVVFHVTYLSLSLSMPAEL